MEACLPESASHDLEIPRTGSREAKRAGRISSVSVIPAPATSADGNSAIPTAPPLLPQASQVGPPMVDPPPPKIAIENQATLLPTVSRPSFPKPVPDISATAPAVMPPAVQPRQKAGDAAPPSLAASLPPPAAVFPASSEAAGSAKPGPQAGLAALTLEESHCKPLTPPLGLALRSLPFESPSPPAVPPVQTNQVAIPPANCQPAAAPNPSETEPARVEPKPAESSRDNSSAPPSAPAPVPAPETSDTSDTNERTQLAFAMRLKASDSAQAYATPAAKLQKVARPDDPPAVRSENSPVPSLRPVPQTTQENSSTQSHGESSRPEPSKPGPAAQPAEPPVSPKTSSTHDIRLELSGSGERRVEVRVTERAGEVRVAVRTPDQQLAGSLRENLPTLSSKLNDSGFRAEAWHPASTGGEWRRSAETNHGSLAHHSDQQSGQQGGGNRPRQDDARRAKTPEQPIEGKKKGNDFAWLISTQ